MRNRIGVYGGEELGRYGFGDGHPFGPDRLASFWDLFIASGLNEKTQVLRPVSATDEDILRFHTREYLDLVRERSRTGEGYLDAGDTPAVPGIFEGALYVVGSVLDAAARIMAGTLTRAMVPIAGLHHARPEGASGFCVFNDCGIAVETLRRVHGLQRIAYVDIDAHHGDGVYYAYAEDPELCIADIHEDGRYLYPGTGDTGEIGIGPARGTKLNVPLPPNADDDLFFRLWPTVERFVDAFRPEFVLFQCGADGLAGDPITDLRLSPAVHRKVTGSLCRIADRHCRGRLLALGGGGYNREHTAQAWTAVIGAMVDSLEAAGRTQT
ncbi:MAG: acetoin utilization protein AcuC [Pseudomonadota bacterium]|nr:acetoin utilization protein AcuC [Pseudomonadota bacterium]